MKTFRTPDKKKSVSFVRPLEWESHFLNMSRRNFTQCMGTPQVESHSCWLTVAAWACLLLTVSLSLPACLQGQEAMTIRKIYVPEESPADWPKGDWRPISAQKFLQRAELTESASQTGFQAPLSHVRYSCRLDGETLKDGQLQTQVPGEDQETPWIRLGKTNLALSNILWDDEPAEWGTGEDGNVYALHPHQETKLSANWSLSGTKVGKGVRFQLQLLRAMQGEFAITLPANVILTQEKTERLPIFIRDLSPELREWTIQGLEGSRLNFTVEPAVDNAGKQQILSREVHLLTIAASEQSFISDFKLERPGNPLSEIEIFLPTGFQPDTVQASQENLSTWKIEPPKNKSAGGSVLKVALNRRSSLSLVNLRVKGRLTHFKKQKLKTHFPRALQTLNLETQVNVAVQAPYYVSSLKTEALLQRDARLVNGVRDVWSYLASDYQPTVQLEVHVPVPELDLQQVIYHDQYRQDVEVRHLMFWSTKQERVFEGRFLVAPGYEVTDVTLFSDDHKSQPVSWNMFRQEKQNLLQVHLPNQLVPDKKIPIAISVRTKVSADREHRLALPALIPRNGQLTHSYLVENGISIEKTLPEQELPEMPAVDFALWSEFWKGISGTGTYRWRSRWQPKDISETNRLIVQAESPDVGRRRPNRLFPEMEPLQLETHLERHEDKLLIRYQLRLPLSRLRNTSLVQMELTAPSAPLKWNIRGQNSVFYAPRHQQDTPPVTVESHLEKNDREIYIAHWDANANWNRDLVLEAFLRLPTDIKELTTIPLLKTGETFEAAVYWQTAQLNVERWETQLEQTLVQPETLGHYHYDFELKAPLLKAGLSTAAPAEVNSVSSLDDWYCRIQAVVHHDSQFPNHVQVAYQSPAAPVFDQTFHFEFPQAVFLHHVTINGRCLPVERTVTKYELPEISHPLRQVVLEYSGGTENQLFFPKPSFPVAIPSLSLCLPEEYDLEASGAVGRWMEIPFLNGEEYRLFSETTPHESAAALRTVVAQVTPFPVSPGDSILRSDSVTPSESPVISSTEMPVRSLLGEYRAARNYRIYRAQWLAAPEASFALKTTASRVEWRVVVWVFLAAFVLGLFLTMTGKFRSIYWSGLTLVGLLGTLWIGQIETLQLVIPCVLAVLLLSLVNDSCQLWLTNVRSEQAAAKPFWEAPLVNVLFKGLGILLLVGSWCNQVGYGQPTPAGGAAPTIPTVAPSSTPVKDTFKEAESKIRVENILIPVKSSQLQPEFRGLEPQEYPEVIYVSSALVQNLTDLTASQRRLDQILFSSAKYQLHWQEAGQIQIQCRFDVLDAARKPRSRIVLPLKNISSLSGLKAVVNGEPVSISPLPDASGLEIPLVNPQKKQVELSADPAVLEENITSLEYLNYQIELSLVPVRENRVRETRYVLDIPPIARTQLECFLPEGMKIQWQRSPQETTLWTATGTEKPLTFDIGGQSQIAFQIPTSGAHSLHPEAEKVERIQTDILTQLFPNHAEMQLNVQAVFGAESPRELTWLLPADMVVRTLHSPDLVEQTTTTLPEKQTQLKLSFSPQGPASVSLLLHCAIPVKNLLTEAPADSQEGNFQRFVHEIPLPQLETPLISKDKEPKWQIGVQAKPEYSVSAIEFPEVASSRLSREVFQETWPEPQTLRDNLQGYRIKRPRMLKVNWQQQVTNLSLKAHHQWDRERESLQLTSRYEGTVTGTPLWFLGWQDWKPWKIQSLKMTVGGQEIPHRILQKNQPVELAMADAIGGDFRLDIVWRYAQPLDEIALTVAPPRILRTTTYQEANSLAPKARGEWVLVPTTASNSTDATAPEISQQKQSWIIRSTASFDLPSFQLFPQEQSPTVEAVLPGILKSTGATEQNTANPAYFQPAQPGALAEQALHPSKESTRVDSSAVPQAVTGVRMDHTLWPAEGKWLGETLLMWQPVEGSMQADFVMRLPENIQMLQLTSAAHLKVIQEAEGWLIRAPHDIPAEERVPCYLLLHWEQSRPSGMTTQEMVLLPQVSLPNQVRWRVLHEDVPRTVPKQYPAAAQESWQAYLKGLAVLGEPLIGRFTTENEIQSSTTPSPFPTISSTPVDWPAECREFYETLTPRELAAIQQATDVLAPAAWLKVSPAYFAAVARTGFSEDSLTEIQLPVSEFPLRLSFLVLTGGWGIGMWLTRDQSFPRLRWPVRLVSLLIVALLLTRLILAESAIGTF